MKLSETVIGLKAFKEADERMEQLWRNIDAAVVAPRLSPLNDNLLSVQIQGDVLQLSGHASSSAEAVLSDLETILVFLSQKLPSDLLPSFGNFMMADIIPRLIKYWLNSAVPSSLKEMDGFQSMTKRASEFCEALDSHGYTGFDELKDWVDNAPSIWLAKCRETTLDAVRAKLSDGIGAPRQVEKIEKQMVSLAEGKEINKTPGAAKTAEANDWGDDWGDAWDDDDAKPETQPRPKSKDGDSAKADEDDGADAWGWDDDNTTGQSGPNEGQARKTDDQDDDSAAAWGWSEEEEPLDAEQEPYTKTSGPSRETRELVLRETYNISSMPEPVLELIRVTLEDGAALTRDDVEHSPVAATAPGLYQLPTFVLALFRAISPYYYSLSEGGNM